MISAASSDCRYLLKTCSTSGRRSLAMWSTSLSCASYASRAIETTNARFSGPHLREVARFQASCNLWRTLSSRPVNRAGPSKAWTHVLTDVTKRVLSKSVIALRYKDPHRGRPRSLLRLDSAAHPAPRRRGKHLRPPRWPASAGADTDTTSALELSIRCCTGSKERLSARQQAAQRKFLSQSVSRYAARTLALRARSARCASCSAN